MSSNRSALLFGCIVGCTALVGCYRGFTVNTFKLSRPMKSGEILQRSDLVPIAIPFGNGHSSSSATERSGEGETKWVEQTVTPESSARVWITADEVDQFVGKPLAVDVEAGDQLVHQMFESDANSEP